ncbi:hypothetical protein [Candidatus Palauibacter sp.]|uniref:hypothetical protein n=1 Tax=Candidatus Palauibacter sp. TaxID=3101350 RepID=UPI003B5923F1
MRRILPSTFFMILLIIPAMLALPQTAAGQECAWSASAGLSIPATRRLRENGMDLQLDRGWIGRLGRECASGTVRYGLGADAQHLDGFGGVYVFSLMGRLGRELLGDPDHRLSWLEVAATAGVFHAFRSGDFVEVLIPERPEETPGRQIDLPGLGFAAGGSVRLGFPTTSSASFFVDVGIRASFLPTEELNGLAKDTPGVLVTLPITLGYQLSL